jgi:hypothetical protein
LCGTAGHELLQGYFPFQIAPYAAFASHGQAIASNLTGMLCWVAIGRYLYLKKWFFNI